MEERDPFHCSKNKIKYLGWNLKEMPRIYMRNTIKHSEGIKNRVNKWNEITYFEIRRLSILKLPIFYKIFCKSNAISIKFFFNLELEELFIWKNKQARITRKNLKMKSNAVEGRRLVLSEFSSTMSLYDILVLLHEQKIKSGK